LNRILCLQGDQLIDEVQRAQFREVLDLALRDVAARSTRVGEKAAALQLWVGEFLEHFTEEAIDCPGLGRLAALEPRLLAEAGLRDYVRRVRAEGDVSRGSEAQVLLLVEGRLLLLTVRVPPGVDWPIR
jgi:hypothetical protein